MHRQRGYHNHSRCLGGQTRYIIIGVDHSSMYVFLLLYCILYKRIDPCVYVSMYLQDTFSISLPIAEENEFEEKFKYLIATSPLLSEVLSVHNANKSNKQRTTQHMTTTTDYSTMATKASRAGVVGTVTTMTGCMMALGIEAFKLRHQLRQQSQPAKLFLGTPVVSMTMMLTSSMSAFFGYRHMVRDILYGRNTRLIDWHAIMIATLWYSTLVSYSTQYITDIDGTMRDARQQSTSCAHHYPRNRIGITWISFIITTITHLTY